MENLNDLLGKLEVKFGDADTVSRQIQDNPQMGTCSFGCTWSEVTKE